MIPKALILTDVSRARCKTRESLSRRYHIPRRRSYLEGIRALTYVDQKMEAFKAVEKEMKTKAFSKEGLLVSAKQDPKEREKDDLRTFLSDMVDELGRQVEESEAEMDSIQVAAKKKKDAGKAERVADLEHKVERHKWHQSKLELLMRALANDDVEPDDVKNVQEDIQHYVDNNREVDFFEDEEIYDTFALDEESDKYAVPQDLDKVSSQENQSMADEAESTPSELPKGKTKSISESTGPARRPSQHKSPLPALASLHNLPTATPATVHTTSSSTTNNMKPAPPPSKPPGETLNYRSAAAAGAANDAAGIGIAPLPPPPGKITPNTAAATPAATQESTAKSATASPSVATMQPATTVAPPEPKAQAPPQQKEQTPARTTAKSPAPSQASGSPAVTAAQLAQASAREQGPTLPQTNGAPRQEPPKPAPGLVQNHDRIPSLTSAETASTASQANGVQPPEPEEDESVFHLPASLSELVDSYDRLTSTVPPPSAPEHHRILDEAFSRRSSAFSNEKPRHYKPQELAVFNPLHYPQQPHPVFNDPRLYGKVDQDALFYSFYYQQGTYQQYLAAKELKATSWRFHKQYQTWFQRHEEPQQITEDFERGTYRFFDYESTW